ncbi:MAG: thiamine diphosphokinase [Lachnospiraceae bacterium]|nr:thiamine diphosphokinase [Lachnospiraceae bacterium]
MNSHDDKTLNARCIIFAAGAFDKEDLAVHGVTVMEEDYVIACDAGLLNCDAAGVTPNLIVGDFDSGARIGETFMDRIARIEEADSERVLRLPVVKDDTDLMRAIKEGLARGYRSFLIFGALGGKRFSLSYAAIQSLLYLKHHDAYGMILTSDAKLWIMEDETTTFFGHPGGALSLFALTERVEGLTLRGLQYELEDATLTNDFPLGVSNAFVEGKTATIAVRKGTLLVVQEDV